VRRRRRKPEASTQAGRVQVGAAEDQAGLLAGARDIGTGLQRRQRQRGGGFDRELQFALSASPPLVQERLRLRADGRGTVKLKGAWRDLGYPMSKLERPASGEGRA
jgi:hypothetical protein